MRRERASPFRNIQPLFFYDRLVGVSQDVRDRFNNPTVLVMCGFSLALTLPVELLPVWVRALVFGIVIGHAGTLVLRAPGTVAKIEEGVEIEFPRLRRKTRRGRKRGKAKVPTPPTYDDPSEGGDEVLEAFPDERFLNQRLRTLDGYGYPRRPAFECGIQNTWIIEDLPTTPPPQQSGTPPAIPIEMYVFDSGDRFARPAPFDYLVDDDGIRYPPEVPDFDYEDERDFKMTITLTIGDDDHFALPPKPVNAAPVLRLSRDERGFRHPKVIPVGVNELDFRSRESDEIHTGIFATVFNVTSKSAKVQVEAQRPGNAIGLGKRPYKSALLKVHPQNAPMPEEYRIVRKRPSDPLMTLPAIGAKPASFVPTAYMTEERMSGFKIDESSHLWDEEKRLLKAIIAANEKAFAWTETERGRFRSDYFPPVKLAVLPHVPWTKRHVPIPPSIRDGLIELLKEKIKAGVYEECNSSYRNSWFCVVKKDGKSLRIVHDLQPLNEHTIRDAGLIPQPDEFSEECAGFTLLSVLDLFSSYDQQLIHEAYRDLTAFQTPVGVLRNVGLPMGYTNSVPIQQANVTFILLEEIPRWANCFIDDVVGKGSRSYYQDEDGTYQTHPDNPGIRRFVWEHAMTLNRILHRLKKAGASVSGKKAIIAQPEAVIVGYRCNFEGRHPEKGNVKKILDWPTPQNVTHVRAFLGTCGVSKLWIKDFAREARPLYHLTRKEVDFEWTPECDHAMKRLKELVTNAPGLKPIDYASFNDVILAVDSSVIGVGYILLQLGDDKKRYPSRYGSITWNDRESRYSQAKLELHGLFRSLRAVRAYIYGSTLR